MFGAQGKRGKRGGETIFGSFPAYLRKMHKVDLAYNINLRYSDQITRNDN